MIAFGLDVLGIIGIIILVLIVLGLIGCICSSVAENDGCATVFFIVAMIICGVVYYIFF